MKTEENLIQRMQRPKAHKFLDALLRGETISSARAYERFGLFRPAVPISRFRERGFIIQTFMLERKNHYGQVVRYGVYYIKPEDMEHNLKIAKNLGL
jgi:hypothetical protein